MQDGKALQAGTSHFLGQNFAKAFDVKFATREGGLEYVWGTSWGVSTRLMGALIMVHSDDDGLILPPDLAPTQIVIIPIYKNIDQAKLIGEKAEIIKNKLINAGYRVTFDNRDTQKPGWKFAEYELKGVPLRLAIGPKDLESGTVEIARRDTREKITYPIDSLDQIIPELLNNIHHTIYSKAKTFMQKGTTQVDHFDEFVKVLDNQGGFIYAHWDGSPETEAIIKDKTKATIRLIPFHAPEEKGKCIYSGKPSNKRVVFARAY
jgi:prolyl-tRNA synthetase